MKCSCSTFSILCNQIHELASSTPTRQALFPEFAQLSAYLSALAIFKAVSYLKFSKLGDFHQSRYNSIISEGTSL